LSIQLHGAISPADLRGRKSSQRSAASASVFALQPRSEPENPIAEATGEHRLGAASATLASVIVLNYNGEAVLARCLDSLLAQTYPNFEIVVVDNNSNDASLALLEDYAARGVRVIRSPENSGVPGGRNLGLVHARGEIIAFIDNDGYADNNWLAAAVHALESDPKIGGVASVVFFANRKIVLNACGGTINRQGYGGDFCYHAPYEFADIPYEVLFPMGCGIVVRKSAIGQMKRFDALPIKWYEDVELGIWLWASGYKVVVAQDAWIDHGWGFSDTFLPSRVYMCERARIRTVVKYYPARRLMSWLWHETRHFRYAESRLRPPLVKAWLWNLRHLPSALGWRWRMHRCKGRFWHMVDPSWGYFPPPVAENGALRPDPAGWGCRLKFDGSTELTQLNFGWHFLERSSNGRTFRWTEEHASAFFRLSRAAITCRLTYFALRGGPIADITLRRIGTLDSVARFRLDARGGWEEAAVSCLLPPGSYEMVIAAVQPSKEQSGRTVGLAISSIDFS
jgi:GT2 family glycosyltransferase